MPIPDDKSLVDNITVNAGGKVVVIGSVSGNVLIHLRDGETELMHKARIELVNYATALFVDIMRLYCVAGSMAARSANSARYQEFVDVADQHVDDFKTHLTRIYPTAEIGAVTDAERIEKVFKWSVTRLRREPELDRSWSAFAALLFELAEQVDALASKVANEYYDKCRAESLATVSEIPDQFNLHRPDDFVRARFSTQSRLLFRLQRFGVKLDTIRDDREHALAIPYFTIDLNLLRAVMQN